MRTSDNIIDLEFDLDSIILPVYRHLVDDDSDVKLLWGGRDSGKTHFIAQKLLIECLELDYFRCIMSKKVGESIKGAQWQALKDVAYDWGIDHLFKFKVSPLSIECVNGNTFIAHGLDKPGKARGITNPSHLWTEETNQITEADYLNISTTLRSNKGRVVEWHSFNPESENGQPEKFWLFKKFYAGVKNIYSNFVRNIEIKLEDGTIAKLKYSSTHTTYRTNPYLSAERRAKIEILKIHNPYYYEVFSLGIWGVKRTGMEMFTGFWDRSKHMRPVGPDYSRPFQLWFDFNRIPYSTCLVVQIHKLPGIIEIRFLDEICLTPPTNSIEHTERVFTAKYGQCTSIYFSGDPTGKNETQTKTSNEARSMFGQVQISFRKYMHNTSNKVPSKAPPLTKRKQGWIDLFNESKGVRVVVDPKCKHLIHDIEMSVEDITGGWLKKKEMDETLGKRVEVIGHAIDAATYGIGANYPVFFYPK